MLKKIFSSLKKQIKNLKQIDEVYQRNKKLINYLKKIDNVGNLNLNDNNIINGIKSINELTDYVVKINSSLIFHKAVIDNNNTLFASILDEHKKTISNFSLTEMFIQSIDKNNFSQYQLNKINNWIDKNQEYQIKFDNLSKIITNDNQLDIDNIKGNPILKQYEIIQHIQTQSYNEEIQELSQLQQQLSLHKEKLMIFLSMPESNLIVKTKNKL